MQLRGRQRHPNGNSQLFNCFFPQAALGHTTDLSSVGHCFAWQVRGLRQRGWAGRISKMQLRGRQRHPNRNSQSFNYFFPQAALGHTTESFQASEFAMKGNNICQESSCAGCGAQ